MLWLDIERYEWSTNFTANAAYVTAMVDECHSLSLSCGIYTLAAGSKDLQSPHDEDEVYYVMSGRARIRIQDEERVVGPGSILYVGATSEHSFVEIEKDMTLLVFFASGGAEES